MKDGIKSGLTALVVLRATSALSAHNYSAARFDLTKKGELSGTLNRQQFRARIERDMAFWRPMLEKLGISAQGDTPAAAPAR